MSSFDVKTVIILAKPNKHLDDEGAKL